MQKQGSKAQETFGILLLEENKAYLLFFKKFMVLNRLLKF